MLADPEGKDLSRFTISADGNRDLFPTVLGLVAEHPSSLEKKGWKVIAFRQPQPIELDSVHLIPSLPALTYHNQSLQMGTVELKMSDVKLVLYDEEGSDKLVLEIQVRSSSTLPPLPDSLSPPGARRQAPCLPPCSGHGLFNALPRYW